MTVLQAAVQSITGALALTLAIAVMAGSGGCRKEESLGGNGKDAPVINIFTEIWQFPDRGAHKNVDSGKSVDSMEPAKFAERYNRLYQARVAKMGGRPPLEGMERVRFEREMMLVQSDLLFEMRLGAEHPAKKKFLDLVAWTFDSRQPIIEKRRNFIMAEQKAFKKAEDLDFKLHDKLLVEVKKKLKAIFSEEDYKTITGGR
jgi:hypothetical protein